MGSRINPVQLLQSTHQTTFFITLGIMGRHNQQAKDCKKKKKKFFYSRIVVCHAAQIVVNELVFKLLCSYRRENQA